MSNTPKIIPDSDAGTLSSIFKQRVEQTPNNIAYIQYQPNSHSWENYTWQETAAEVARIQASLLAEGLQSGDKLAIMLSNSREWVMFDQAAQGLGLIIVPIYTNDRPDNVAYILEDAEVKLMVIENTVQYNSLEEIHGTLSNLLRIVVIRKAGGDTALASNAAYLENWQQAESAELISNPIDKDTLATIVYTSGTTGRPKGVMLSHRNILSNIYTALNLVDVYEEDVFLSFLPLSHMLERMAGYYLPIVAGSTVAFSRSIAQLASDLLTVRPTVLISVPRIFERVYGKIQDKLATESGLKQKLFNTAIDAGWKKFQLQQHKSDWKPVLLVQPILDKLVGAKVREKMGGRMRLTVCGGAPLSDKIAQFFIGLGIPILQGYGLTETSPFITVNIPENNDPASVGIVPPTIDVKIGDNDEIMAKSDGVMLGYWHNPEATKAVVNEDGWLHTGDKGKLENDHLYITGRIKEIIVLANGEKIPPSDMELAISLDAMVEQAMIIGESRPYLSALVVLNEEALAKYRQDQGKSQDWDFTSDRDLQKLVMVKVKAALHDFPGYAKIRRITLCNEPWTVENGLLTPTLKTKRAKIEQAYANDIAGMYEGHN